MAILTFEDGRQTTQLAEIAAALAPLDVVLSQWPVGEEPQLQRLLAQDALNDAEKEQVLAGLDHYFADLQQSAGYQSRDLIVLHPEVPNLDALLSKFSRCHTHADDEVRYIVAGAGVFGFVCPDGSQVELTIQAEEYINVPAGTEHWFLLTPQQRVKAIRYFTTTTGWTPEYTATEIRMGAISQPPLAAMGQS